MFYIKWLTLFIIVLILGCASESTVEKDLGDYFIEPSQEEILSAINKVRSQNIDCKNGLGYVGPSQPLRWNEELYNSANEHSEDMSKSGIFSHKGSGTQYDITGYNRGRKSNFNERIIDNGYSGYHVIGENIAGGYFKLEEVIEEWKKSPKHCENLMREDFEEVGVAITINPNSQYGIYWTQNFGKRNQNQEERE
jgi:uncharacterized protein YkwD